MYFIFDSSANISYQVQLNTLIFYRHAGKCLGREMNGYMTRPIKREKLFEMIRCWVAHEG